MHEYVYVEGSYARVAWTELSANDIRIAARMAETTETADDMAESMKRALLASLNDARYELLHASCADEELAREKYETLCALVYGS